MWIDTHVHLDASEFDADRLDCRERALQNGVHTCIYPAVSVSNFDTVRQLAYHDLDRHTDYYALGIHPLYSTSAQEQDIAILEQQLRRYRGGEPLRQPASYTLPKGAARSDAAFDEKLIAVGEIGLDFFVPSLNVPSAKAHQIMLFQGQLDRAQRYGLPVIIHSRAAVEAVIMELRRRHTQGGIAHAFNGSLEQAKRLLDLGFKLGFGGAISYERALHLRRLVQALPIEAFVLETDAPDMPPQWLYVTAKERQLGCPQARNEPVQLPAIAAVFAQLRNMSLEQVAFHTSQNAIAALRLAGAAKSLQ